MYTAKYHRNDNLDEIKAFVQANSFGILVSQVENRPWATHIPIEWNTNAQGENVLQGHIARANKQWRHFADNEEVLAIFNGPHTYISSSWYSHENVPTWNYIAVHAYGKLRIIEGEELYQTLKDLVNKYEATSKNPVAVERMSDEYVRREMKGIVGFEIAIQDIQATYKLSKNRNDADYENIIQELEERGDAHSVAIAQAMKSQKS